MVLSEKQRFPYSEAVFRWHLPTKANGHVRTPACRLHLNEDGARAHKQSSLPSAGRCLTGPAFGGFCSTVNDARYGTAAACRNRRYVAITGGGAPTFGVLILAAVRVLQAATKSDGAAFTAGKLWWMTDSRMVPTATRISSFATRAKPDVSRRRK